MFLRASSTLWVRLAVAFALFAGAGSLLLVLWLDVGAQRVSQENFTSLARTNAELVRSARLPTTERTAEYLGRVLNLQVYFRREPSGEIHPPRDAAQPSLAQVRPDAGVVSIDGGHEAIAVPIEKEISLLLVRTSPSHWALLRQGETLLLLAVLGLLSAALAWVLVRDFVRPLRQLTRRLPHIGHDPDATLPGVDRADEIGQLARAYVEARRQLNDERARREQAEKLALLGRMATGLAHEIHNPLAAIRMHAQLLESTEPAQLGAAAAESLPVLIGETARIESLVQQWMFLARPQPPQMSPTRLTEVVQGVVRALGPQAAHAQVRMECDVPDAILVRADARRLAQAIGNVAMNALQAMPRGGALSFSVAAEDAVALCIRDSGPGFSEAALARHAELFFSEKEGGMGIGLSVASEIMKAHGGALTVANAPGGGALVTLRFADVAAKPVAAAASFV